MVFKERDKKHLALHLWLGKSLWAAKVKLSLLVCPQSYTNKANLPSLNYQIFSIYFFFLLG